MSIYEIEHNGKLYEIEAPNEEIAIKALNLKNDSIPQASEGTLSQYFSGDITDEQKLQIEQGVREGTIKLPKGYYTQPYAMPTDTPEKLTGIRILREHGLLDQIAAIPETVGTLVTGLGGQAIASAKSFPNIVEQIFKGVTGQLTEEQAMQRAKEIEKQFQSTLQDYTYEGGEISQEQVQNLAKFLEPLTAIAPMQEFANIAGASGRTAKVQKGNILKGKQQTIEKAGITPLTTDIKPPETAFGKQAQALGEKIPVVGTGGIRAAQKEQRINAVYDTMKDLGYGSTDDVIENATKDLIKTRSNKISKYSNMKKKIFETIDNSNPNLKVKVENTLNSIDNEIARIEGLGLQENSKAVSILKDFKQAFQDKNIQAIEEIRKSLGDKLNDEGIASIKSTLEKSANRIYTSLNEDIGNHIGSYGSKNDFTKWKVANKRLSGMMDEINVNSLKNVLSKGSQTPESINNMLFSANESTIKTLYRNLSSDGKANAKLAIINKIMDKAVNEDHLSINKFLTELDKQGKPLRVFFKGEDLEKIKGLQKALKLTRRADEASLTPATGVQNVIPTVASGAIGALGGWGGLAAIGGFGTMARIYESKAISNLLIKLGKSDKSTEKAILNTLNTKIQDMISLELQQQGENNGSF